MANDPQSVKTSAEIAAHAGTNPVVVRRVLGRLREAGILTSEKGHSGGWKLAQSADQITLADVYIALDESLIADGNADEASDCSVENALLQRVTNVLNDVEKSLIERLGRTTIAQVCPLSD